MELHSERYAPTGNIASDGINNQLGRPNLDPLTVLVRESVQNCWDARLPDRRSIDVTFHLSTASLTQRKVWCERVFPEVPGRLGIRERLDDTSRPWRVLTISDRGTSGLGGPTRADVLPKPGVPSDFVDFLRNLGSPPDKSMGGGTYGFGKAALFAGSDVHALLAYTRCREAGGYQTRLIGAAVGEQYQVDAGRPESGRYTGRHWWGRKEGDLVEPLLDADADDLARALGLPLFGPTETGTTLSIVDFRTGSVGEDESQERTPQEALSYIRAALVWNFWPKLVSDEEGGPAPIHFRLLLDGAEQQGPNLTLDPGLQSMAKCLREVRARCVGKSVDSSVKVEQIWTGNPRKHLGYLALTRFMQPATRTHHTTGEALGAPAGPMAHHVALMRSAELVVRYETGAPLPSPAMGYAGVFVVARDTFADRAFAAAEPPTHDDWVVQGVRDPGHRSAVRLGLKRVRHGIREFVEPAATTEPAGSGRPLGQLSDTLGDILSGLPGTGSRFDVIPERRAPSRPTVVDDDTSARGGEGISDSTDPAEHAGSAVDDDAPEPVEPSDADGPGGLAPSTTVRGGSPVRVGRPRVRLSDPRLEVIDDIGVLRLEVDVRAGHGSAGTLLSVSPSVIIEGGGREGAPPAGAEVPTVLRWLDPDGCEVPVSGLQIGVPLEKHGVWTLDVRLIDDAQIQVSVSGQPVIPS